MHDLRALPLVAPGVKRAEYDQARAGLQETHQSALAGRALPRWCKNLGPKLEDLAWSLASSPPPAAPKEEMRRVELLAWLAHACRGSDDHILFLLNTLQRERPVGRLALIELMTQRACRCPEAMDPFWGRRSILTKHDPWDLPFASLHHWLQVRGLMRQYQRYAQDQFPWFVHEKTDDLHHQAVTILAMDGHVFLSKLLTCFRITPIGTSRAPIRVSCGSYYSRPIWWSKKQIKRIEEAAFNEFTIERMSWGQEPLTFEKLLGQEAEEMVQGDEEREAFVEFLEQP